MILLLMQILDNNFLKTIFTSQETINYNNKVNKYQNFNLANSQIFIYDIFSGNILYVNMLTLCKLHINTYTANMRIELTRFLNDTIYIIEYCIF